MSNNIRTISLLLDLNNGSPTFKDLSSANLFIEVSKNDNTNNNVQTYKLSMAKFLELLIEQIHTSGNGWWVTCDSKQTITGEKTFTNNVHFNNETQIDENGVIHSDKIIEGTARKAYWA